MLQDVAKVVKLRALTFHAFHNESLKRRACFGLVQLEKEVVADPEDVLLILQLPDPKREHHPQQDTQVPRVLSQHAEPVQAILLKLVIERGADATEDLSKLLRKYEGSRFALESHFRLRRERGGGQEGGGQVDRMIRNE